MHLNKPFKKNNRKILLWIFSFPLFLFLTFPSRAQQLPDNGFIIIHGSIVDENEVSLPGVNIHTEHGKESAVSDVNGKFKITVGRNGKLIYSLIGYERKAIAYKGSSEVTVQLHPSRSQLEEVVVVGYGAQSKSRTVSAISTIAGKELENRPAASFEYSMQGKAPGLTVLNNTGMPGQRSIILVRGLSAVARKANTQTISSPLFVVDDIPLIQQADSLGSRNGPQLLNSILAGINPFDIASIDILKDASATAIYGARAANGVILIRTKRGEPGKPRFSFNSQAGVSYIPQLRPTIGGNAEREYKIKLYDEYAYYYNKLNPGVNWWDIPMPRVLTDSLNTFYNNSTNWQKEILRNSVFKDFNLAISGGNDSHTYRLSTDYYDENGIVSGTGFKRYSLHYNATYTPSSRLKLSSAINLNETVLSRGNVRIGEQATVGNDFLSSLYPKPSSDFYNEYTAAYQKKQDGNKLRNMLAILQGSYDVTNFLSINSRIAANYLFGRRNTFSPSELNQDNKTRASIYSQEDLNLINENFIRLHHVFRKKHNFDLTVGNSVNTYKKDIIDGRGKDGPGNQVTTIVGYKPENTFLETQRLSYGLLSYYGRLNYGYQDKYLVQLAARADGSSKYGKENKWGYFPSVAAGWVLSKENFFRGTLDKTINYAKIRASVGKSGNQYDDFYLAQGLYAVGKTSAGRTYNGVVTVNPDYTSANGIPLPELSWEKSTQYNLGFDAELLGSRIILNYDYYYKRTDNFLFDYALPPVSGYSSKYMNGGQLANFGHELGLTFFTMPAGKAFQWNVTVNLASNTNVLLKLPDGNHTVNRTGNGLLEGAAPQLMVGRPVNGFFLYNTTGVYRSDEKVPVNNLTGERLKYGANGELYNSAGDAKYQDINHDNIIDERDRVYLGSPNPKLTGGIQHNFSYRLGDKESTIELGLFFTFVTGRKIYNEALRTRLENVTWADNIKDVYKNYPDLLQKSLPVIAPGEVWTPEDTKAPYPDINYWKGKYSINNHGNYSRLNSLFLESGDFIRLKYISMAYAFSNRLIQRLNINKLRVFAGMDNVFIIQKYSGADAENVDVYGYDQGNGYPLARKINLGVNITF